MRLSRVPELLQDRERESVVTFGLVGLSCGVVILPGTGFKGERPPDGDSVVSGDKLVIGGSKIEEDQDLGLGGQCVGFYSPCHLSHPCPL